MVLLQFRSLAVHTGQLVYGPVIAARRWLDRGLLVRIDLEEIKKQAPLMLHVHGDRISRAVQRELLDVLARIAPSEPA